MYFVSSQDHRSVVAPDGTIICKATNTEFAEAIAAAMNTTEPAEKPALEKPAGVWTYVFPDAFEGGRSKTITISTNEMLSHSEVEGRMERYGATSCQVTPPNVTPLAVAS